MIGSERGNDYNNDDDVLGTRKDSHNSKIYTRDPDDSCRRGSSRWQDISYIQTRSKRFRYDQRNHLPFSEIELFILADVASTILSMMDAMPGNDMRQTGCCENVEAELCQRGSFERRNAADQHFNRLYQCSFL